MGRDRIPSVNRQVMIRGSPGLDCDAVIDYKCLYVLCVFFHVQEDGVDEVVTGMEIHTNRETITVEETDQDTVTVTRQPIKPLPSPTPPLKSAIGTRGKVIVKKTCGL